MSELNSGGQDPILRDKKNIDDMMLHASNTTRLPNSSAWVSNIRAC